MDLKNQLIGFKKENPHHEFRISFCECSKSETIQVVQYEGWFCLHDFYEANNKFKLGEGF